MLLLIQGGFMMAQTETVVTVNGKKVSINPNSLNTADNGLSALNGNVQLGGSLTKPSILTTTDTFTLAIKGLQTGINSENIVAVDENGVLRIIPRTNLGDNLGNHIATMDLEMSKKNINNIFNAYVKNDLQIADRITTNTNYFGIYKNNGVFGIWNNSKSSNDLTIDETTRKTGVNNLSISKGTDGSTPAANSVAVSADASGNVIWKNLSSLVDGSETKVNPGTNVTVTGAGTVANPYVVNATSTADNLGNHTATQDLNMNSKNITAATNIAATGTVTAANVTASTKVTAQTAAITKGTDGSTPAANSIAVSADASGNVVWKNVSSLVDGSETKVNAGSNVTVTGAGTIASPYIVNATSTADNLGNHTATQDLNMSGKSINNINSATISWQAIIKDRNGANTNNFGILKNNGVFSLYSDVKGNTLTIDETTGKTTVQSAAITKGTDGSIPAANSVATSADASGNVVWKTVSSLVDGSETKVNAGTNVTVTGTGTVASPYVVNATSTADNLGNHTAAQDLNMNTKNITAATNITATGTAAAANVTASTKVTAQTAAITKGTDGSIPAANSVAVSADESGNVVWKTVSSLVDGSETKVNAGTNVTVTGTGTVASPYVVNATSVADNLGNHTATQNLEMSNKDITNIHNAYIKNDLEIFDRVAGNSNYFGIYKNNGIFGIWNNSKSGNDLTIDEATRKTSVNNFSISKGTDGSTPAANSVATSADASGNVVWKTVSSLVDGSETKVNAGTNVTVTGAGTVASPYVVNATSTADNLGNHTATQDLNMSSKNITAANNITAAGKTTTQTAAITKGTDGSTPAAGSIATSVDTAGNVVWKDPSAVVGTQAWTLTGNASTTPGTNFLGTIDNQDMVLKTNNLERMRVMKGGNVGVGSNNPKNKFSVSGGPLSQDDWSNGDKFLLLGMTGANKITEEGTMGNGYYAGAIADVNNNPLSVNSGYHGWYTAINGAWSRKMTLDTNGNLDFAGALKVGNLPAGLTSESILTADTNGNIHKLAAGSLGDNLGNHTATQDLNMSSKNITAATNVTATGTVTAANITASTKATAQTAAITKGTDGSTPAANSVAVSADANGNVIWKTVSSLVDGSETKVNAGTNVTVTGAGTVASPYVVNATSAADNLGNHTATQDLNLSNKNINNIYTATINYQAVIKDRNTANTKNFGLYKDTGVFGIWSDVKGNTLTIDETTGKTTVQSAAITKGTDGSAPAANSVAVSADASGNVIWKNLSSLVDGSETKLSAGTNVTVTGTGTVASPYVVNATSTADNLGNHTATQDLNMSTKNITGATNVTATGTVAAANVTASSKVTAQTAAITKGTDGSTPAVGSIAVSTDTNGNISWANPSTIGIEPWQIQGGTNKATANTDNIYQTGKVGIGTNNMLGTADANVKLAVNGSIITPTSYYADYVFEDYLDGKSDIKSSYAFKSLDEVEKFITENKHLPGVTSIKDLKRNEKGEYIFNMTDLSIQSLEKIEELYLHTIEQQKELDANKKEMKEMNDRISALEKLIKDNIK